VFTPNLEPQYQVTAIFIGGIDRCKDFKVDKKGFGNGFGQMGQSRFQFVLRSVSDVSPDEAKEMVSLSRLRYQITSTRTGDLVVPELFRRPSVGS